MLLSRPTLSAEALPYYEAFVELDADRPTEAISLGLAGGTSVPKLIAREVLRNEGRRLGFKGEELEDFVDILRIVDKHFVMKAMGKVRDELQTSLSTTKRNATRK